MRPSRAQLRALRRVINPVTYRMMTEAGFAIDDLNLPRLVRHIGEVPMVRWMRGPICVGIWAKDTITTKDLIGQVMRGAASHTTNRVALALTKLPSIKRRLKTDRP